MYASVANQGTGNHSPLQKLIAESPKMMTMKKTLQSSVNLNCDSPLVRKSKGL